VLGDHHGQLVHLFERECSVQRRFQKIVEETPSPALDEPLRQRICEAAAGIARSVRYRNAGTIEFIARGEDFYFLEMNTRLQVEHPVTEAITGFDLVSEQLRVAAGEALGYEQAEVSRSGHAFEFRIYAEDAAQGYVPTTGPVLLLRFPKGPGIRVDYGINEGQSVTAAFDPMLAKLIVHGTDRNDAMRRADQALSQFVLLGCKTNVDFLRRLLGHDAFRAGQIHTGFLDANPEIAGEADPAPGTLVRALAVASLTTPALYQAAQDILPMHAAMGSWRN
jgi:propionyl-CoA carboxylase alpha chain/3-methylcrotonyl-CoA carboxylase alpha subunit/acetyl-CoA/propionyl-CoA carboxylase biotin carboxyl carrier protein